ncbi:uncharacterized protein [Arachis hypogaea]|uniref:uncharacterized protein isoform X2 n=1 Tax=Arachis hypogaea TaxID=3818 RepID=UPI003B224016
MLIFVLTKIDELTVDFYQQKIMPRLLPASFVSISQTLTPNLQRIKVQSEAASSSPTLESTDQRRSYRHGERQRELLLLRRLRKPTVFRRRAELLLLLLLLRRVRRRAILFIIINRFVSLCRCCCCLQLTVLNQNQSSIQRLMKEERHCRLASTSSKLTKKCMYEVIQKVGSSIRSCGYGQGRIISCSLRLINMMPIFKE